MKKSFIWKLGIPVLLMAGWVWAQNFPDSPFGGGSAVQPSTMTGFTADTSPTSDDIVWTVNDPGGTAANRKVTLANLPKGMSTFTNASTFSGVNAASGSANAITGSGTLGIFNGSDTFRGLFLDYTNANHTGTGNTVALIDLDAIAGDAETNLYGIRVGALTGTTGSVDEVEYAVRLGTGWDYGIYADSNISVRSGTTGGSLHLAEGSGGGAGYIGHKAPDAITTSVTYTWPEAPAGNDYLLKSSTAGTLAWTNIITGTFGGFTANRAVSSDGSGNLQSGTDLIHYEATNDGNPLIALGASATERLTITTTYDAGAQTLDYVTFATVAAGAGADAGEMIFSVDATEIARFNDQGIKLSAGVLQMGTGTPDAAGEVGFDGTDKFSFFGANSDILYLRVGSTADNVIIGSGTSAATITFADFTTFVVPAVTNPFIKFDETDGTDWWLGVNDAANSIEFRSSATVATGLFFQLLEGGNEMLLSTTTVAFNADGDTTLYTVPAGKRCVLTKAIIVAAGDAASTDITIGQDTAENDWLPTNQMDNLDAANDAIIVMPVPATTPTKIKSYAAATVIQINVANQAGAAGNTVYLYGILY